MIFMYIFVGLIWAMLAPMSTRNNPDYSKSRRFLTIFLNIILWWIAIPVWLYAKFVLKQNTLVEKDK